MLPWMLTGIGIVAFFAIWIIRNAQADDKRRKLTRKSRDN